MVGFLSLDEILLRNVSFKNNYLVDVCQVIQFYIIYCYYYKIVSFSVKHERHVRLFRVNLGKERGRPRDAAQFKDQIRLGEK
jgi:hypothetical protein